MRITKWERFVLYPLLAGLLILFAFVDLPTMQFLYDPSNAFGRFGELCGEIPLEFLGVVSSLWLFRFRDKTTKKRSVLFGILFLILALFFAGYGGGQIHSYLNNPYDGYSWNPGWWILAPVAALYLGLGALVAFRVKISDPREAVIFAWFVILFYALTWLTMNLGKFLWFRPRWRYLDATYGAAAPDYFQPWYVLKCSGKIGKDDFSSFPSGHTMNALGWIVFAGASSFIAGLKGKEWIIRLSAYVWALLIALSRTIMGAHFFSDTTAGFLLELLLFDLLGRFFFPWFRAKVLIHVTPSEKPLKTASD